MLNSKKIGIYIAGKRRKAGLSQQQLADRLHITFQAVSKWEQGITYPNIELLPTIAKLFNITVDELLLASDKESEQLSYKKAGVDIAYTDSLKKEMAKHLKSNDKRILNGLGAFASLYDISFPKIAHPVLVLKSEEPGSKQKLALEYGYTESICSDLINHLVNDIIVMGAAPLAVLDTIVCSNAEKDTISSLVKGISAACHYNECSLVGGETSIQPHVVENGVYILTASIAGIVDKDQVIDGSFLSDGDCILAIASNGLHTNGYSLVRLLMDSYPKMKLDQIEGSTFLEQIMKPHTSYYKSIKPFLQKKCITGMAHITGGGIRGNVCRIIPEGLSAVIDLHKIKILPVFQYIKEYGNIAEEEMLSTFNCGVGMVIITKPEWKDNIISQINRFYPCYEIGRIESNEEKVCFLNHVLWK